MTYSLSDFVAEYQKSKREKQEENRLLEEQHEREKVTLSDFLLEVSKAKTHPKETLIEEVEVEEVDYSDFYIDQQNIKSINEDVVESPNIIAETANMISELVSQEDPGQNNEIEQLKREIETLKKLIVSTPNKFQYTHHESGGELNLLKPVHTISDYDILGSGGKDLILCDTLENDIIITLPEASKNNGFIAHIKKMHRNNQLYIRGYNSTQLIDEQIQVVINTIYVTLQIACDGSNWYIV